MVATARGRVLAGRPMPPGRRLATAAVVALALLAGTARAEVVNRIIATVDGEPITQHQLDVYATERAGLNLSQQELLESLITDRILEKEAEKLGIQVKDADIDAYIAQVRERNHMTEAQFEEAVAKQGIAMPAYRERIKDEIQKSMLVNREIRGRVTVSNEEVERYYEAHKAEFATAEGMTVRDILFLIPKGADAAQMAEVQAQAEAVHQQLVAGASFEKLADEYTQGPGKGQGGLLGTFKKGEMAPELERSVARLKAGQVSEVIRTPAGFHIIKVDAMETSGYRPLSEVQEEIRTQLYGEDLQKRFEEWLQRDLRERHDVQIYEQ